MVTSVINLEEVSVASFVSLFFFAIFYLSFEEVHKHIGLLGWAGYIFVE